MASCAASLTAPSLSPSSGSGRRRGGDRPLGRLRHVREVAVPVAYAEGDGVERVDALVVMDTPPSLISLAMRRVHPVSSRMGRVAGDEPVIKNSHYLSLGREDCATLLPHAFFSEGR